MWKFLSVELELDITWKKNQIFLLKMILGLGASEMVVWLGNLGIPVFPYPTPRSQRGMYVPENR